MAAVAVRGWRIDSVALATPPEDTVREPKPEAPAQELHALLGEHSGRVLEVVRYRIDPERVIVASTGIPQPDHLELEQGEALVVDRRTLSVMRHPAIVPIPV